MEFIIWIIIAVLFAVSFIGLLYPVIPSVLLIWAGVGLHHFFIDASTVSWWTWTTLIILTILIFIADYMASMYFVTRSGATKRGMRAATIGLIAGTFIIPPFGVFIVPFILVFITEYFQTQELKKSLLTAAATLIGFLTSSLAKGFIQFVIIAVFLIDVLIF